jgi:hypothetical protein
MCAEASTILRVLAADFFFNSWYLETPSDNRIRHISMCVHYHVQGFQLETFRISMLEVVSLLSRCSLRYLISSSWGSCTLFVWTGRHVSLRVVNVTWIDLDSLAFILHFFKPVLDCKYVSS